MQTKAENRLYKEIIPFRETVALDSILWTLCIPND